jgi:hypothetical protein
MGNDQYSAAPRAGLMRAIALSIGLLFSVEVLEATLRLMPQIIPPKVLTHFAPELRQAVASGRYLTRDQVRLVPRDDNGPNLWILKPHGKKPYDFPDEGLVRLVTYDDIGFCNQDGRYKETEAFDIIALGDSFTACHAVESADTWPLQIEELVDASVYNLGTGGVGPYEYIQLLKTFGLPRSPRVVIMNVYEGNDLRDALRFADARKGGVRELDARTESQHDGAGRNATWLGRHSYAFNLVFALGARLGQLSQQYNDQRGVDFRYTLAFEDGEVAMNPANEDTIEVVNGRHLESGGISVEVVDEALEAFIALSKEHEFTPIVMYSPSAQTAYASVVRFDDPSIAGALAYHSRVQREYYARKARELGFAFLDLTPTLAEAADSKPSELLYYPSTLHYTAPAHKVVAREIASLLDELGLAEAG